MRTAIFQVITQRAVVISYRRFGTTTSVKPSEDATDSLSRNPEDRSFRGKPGLQRVINSLFVVLSSVKERKFAL
jgi:hypothetical protein